MRQQRDSSSKTTIAQSAQDRFAPNRVSICGRLDRLRQGVATFALMYYTISVLSGLAATQMLRGRSVGRLETELGYLKETLERGGRGK